MLMQIGSVTFEIWPFNTHGYSRETGADFAAKDTMNNMRPREFMGEAGPQRKSPARAPGFPNFSQMLRSP